ncbi:DUF721 domain-containing protein [Alkalisalibacterium limincola]|uniref:DUF721 domain-containing protein n=2 Tax=Alkalisalibacterium limincola TaxID=2699169 RepID=A0A5C8KXP5_9GAMM|nr:DUF721 domain-containing protein [Alkalisalibacterium limincola]
MLKRTAPHNTRAAGAPDRPRPPLEVAREAGLGGVVDRALWLGTIDQTLRLALPPELAPHCRLGNVRDGTLVFLVNSPVWKAKLRLYADAILATARDLDIPASELLVKFPRCHPAPRPTRHPAPYPTTPVPACARQRRRSKTPVSGKSCLHWPPCPDRILRVLVQRVPLPTGRLFPVARSTATHVYSPSKRRCR